MTMYLYRKMMRAVTLTIAIAFLSFTSQAQYRRPQPERTTPRAIGVLETYKNGSRRLVPVTFFYEKHYYDATLYHATPVPFTLYSETVYEVQQSGKPLGTFTVQSATQNAAVWFGNGRFKPAPDPATLAKKSIPPPVVLKDSSRPTLKRHEGSEGDTPAPHPAAAASTAEADDDPDRPKLHRSEGSRDTPASSTAQAPAPAKAPESQPNETSGQDPERPKLHRKSDSPEGKPATRATAPAGTAAPVGPQSGTGRAAPPGAREAAELTPSEDPDHPILRRGKPVQEQSGRDLPDFKKEEPVSRQIAISDAGPSEAQPLTYVCSEDERRQIEQSVRQLAEAELRRMAVQRGIALPPAMVRTPASAKKGAVRKTPVIPELSFKDEQFVLYDLDYNNYTTVVFSARHTLESDGWQGAGEKSRSWVVTVVARQNEGKLTKLYSSVSDPRELDLYPEVRLVDALDPEGYGRAALLFRERKRDGVSWRLERASAYELQTILETPSR